jgi:hypothetical protein
MATLPVQPSPSDNEFLLLVEGPSDRHAVSHLLKLVSGAEPPFEILDCGGDDGVLKNLSSRLADANLRQRIVGLILDTDIEKSTGENAVQRRWAEIKGKIGVGYSLPNDFPETGLIIDPLPGRKAKAALPRIGAWLMPNNKAFGMFEDLLMESLRAEEKDYTSKVVMQAKIDGIARYSESHLSKAVVRTYMAWQEPPDLPHLSLAIQEGHFQNIEAACAQFLDWLGRLFVPLTL